MTEQTNPQLTEDEIIAWSKEAYQRATGFLAEKGVVTETVSMENSRYLAPVIAIWKLKSTDGKWFWVICGDVPTDLLTEESADDPRSAVRAFSMRWQLQAENIRANSEADKTQLEFAALLQGRAEGLYQLFENETLWQSH